MKYNKQYISCCLMFRSNGFHFEWKTFELINEDTIVNKQGVKRNIKPFLNRPHYFSNEIPDKYPYIHHNDYIKIRRSKDKNISNYEKLTRKTS